MKSLKTALGTFVLIALSTVMLLPAAQATIAGAGGIAAQEQGDAQADVEVMQRSTNWRSGSYAELSAPMPKGLADLVQPFGSQLFEGGFSGVRADDINSDYKVTPGDQVTLRLWGAVEFERIMPVDAQGNLFIPSVGPVSVQGLTPPLLDAKIKTAVMTVYPENVGVYTNLQGVQPVAIFVTGYVTKPGRYAGTPNDSAIYFLAQAGGIEASLGSYRNITVIRNKKVVETIDLYDFLLAGIMPRPQFRDGDTLLVGETQNSVVVMGDVARGYRYELKQGELYGEALVKLARLKSGVSHVLLRGDREAGPFSGYFSIDEFDQQPLQNGDEILLSVDKRQETIIVQLEGSYFGPSRYIVSRNTRLQDFLDTVAVPQHITDAESISLSRKSVAIRQKAALKESLRRLQSTYLIGSSAGQDSSVRLQEVELINRFVERAEEVQPSGRLVVALEGDIANIRLQDGDLITIPEKSDSLIISGEVLVPQSVVFNAGRTVSDYIAGAGGFTRHADGGQILIVRQNGEVVSADDVVLKAGDEILVMPKVPTDYLRLATSITQILYQVAIATAVVLDVGN
jgi:protein involved in polysaccharide export with SLBB domain